MIQFLVSRELDRILDLIIQSGAAPARHPLIASSVKDPKIYFLNQLCVTMSDSVLIKHTLAKATIVFFFVV